MCRGILSNLNNSAKNHWINQDPDNDSYTDQQLEREFRRTRENLYNLLKKFFIENFNFSRREIADLKIFSNRSHFFSRTFHSEISNPSSNSLIDFQIDSL